MSRSGLSLLPLLCACATVGAGCAGGDPGPETTQLVVVIDAELVVPDELDGVRLEVTGPTRGPDTASATLSGPGAQTLPVTIGLVAGGTALEPVTLVAVGSLARGDVVRETITTGFVRDSSRLVRITLRRACLGCTVAAGCPPDECLPEDAPAAMNPRFSGTVPGREELCNARDDDGDGSVDEDFDLTTDAWHCGSCAHACTVGYSCVAGACVPGAPSLPEVAVGGNHACLRLTSGMVYCWGASDQGQTGCGTPVTATKAVAVAGVTDATTIAVGSDFACARLRSGEVDCWGNNSGAGRLGDGTTTDHCMPRAITGINDAASLALARASGCVARGRAGVSCWGANQFGQLGTGSRTTSVDMGSSTPVGVIGLPAMTDAVSVAVSDSASCALLSTGAFTCWGGDDPTIYRDGSLTRRDVPGPPQGSRSIQIALGALHACTLSAAGVVSCWGDNAHGQLGDGAAALMRVTAGPVPVPERVTALAAAGNRTCAIGVTGALYCWGANDTGQVGDGTTTDREMPVRVMLTGEVVSVGTSAQTTCAALRTGQAWCWGSSTLGQVGDGMSVTTGARNIPTPVRAYPMPG